jgi:hypothetical protein
MVRGSAAEVTAPKLPVPEDDETGREQSVFTCIEKKETFVEEALVSKVPGRGEELIAQWKMGAKDLLDMAVMHEMGHGPCESTSEQRANHLVAQMMLKKSLGCRAPL